MKKILIIDSSVDVTGAFNCALMMAEQLSVDSLVELLVPHGSSERLKRYNNIVLNKNTKYYEKEIPILRKSIKKIITYPFQLLHFALEINNKLSKSKFDVIILNDINFLIVTLLRMMGWNGEVVVWMRSHPELYGKILSSLYFKDIYYGRAKLICVSNVVKLKVPIYLEPFVIYDAIESKLPLIDDDKTNEFIMLANYIPGKGQDIALQSLTILKNKGIKCKIKFYGSTMGRPKNEIYLSFLKKESKRMGIEHIAVFMNQVQPDSDLYKKVLAALSLSKLEALSMSVMEACAAGVPVISTKSGGPEEIISDSESGFIIPISDPHALADKMEIFLKNKSLSTSMGLCAFLLMKSKFSPYEFRKKLLNILFSKDHYY